MSDDFFQKYVKYKIKYLNAKKELSVGPTGDTCRTICEILKNLTYILIHGACLDGAMTAYLLRKYCEFEYNKIMFIAPGNNIIEKIDFIKRIKPDPKKIEIGLYDLALPTANIVNVKGKLINVNLDELGIVKIVDHHFSTKRFENNKSVTYSDDYAACGLIWKELTGDSSLITANKYLQVINKGDRGQLSLLNEETIDDFIIYIGLQKLLDYYSSINNRTLGGLVDNKFHIIDASIQMHACNQCMDKWVLFTNIINYIIDKEDPLLKNKIKEYDLSKKDKFEESFKKDGINTLLMIQIVGAIEIFRTYNYISKNLYYGSVYDMKGHDLGIKALFIPKEQYNTVISQFAGKTLKNIDYVIVYPPDGGANPRITLRGVSEKSNANELANLINGPEAGGHIKAASVGVSGEYIQKYIKIYENEKKDIKNYFPSSEELQKASIKLYNILLNNETYWYRPTERALNSSQFDTLVKNITNFTFDINQYLLIGETENEINYNDMCIKIIMNGARYPFTKKDDCLVKKSSVSTEPSKLSATAAVFVPKKVEKKFSYPFF